MELYKEQVIEKLKNVKVINGKVEGFPTDKEEMLDIFKWYLKNGPVFIDNDGNSTDSVIPLITNERDIKLLEYSMVKIKQFTEL